MIDLLSKLTIIDNNNISSTGINDNVVNYEVASLWNISDWNWWQILLLVIALLLIITPIIHLIIVCYNTRHSHKITNKSQLKYLNTKLLHYQRNNSMVNFNVGTTDTLNTNQSSDLSNLSKSSSFNNTTIIPQNHPSIIRIPSISTNNYNNINTITPSSRALPFIDNINHNPNAYMTIPE